MVHILSMVPGKVVLHAGQVGKGPASRSYVQGQLPEIKTKGLREGAKNIPRGGAQIFFGGTVHFDQNWGGGDELH